MLSNLEFKISKVIPREDYATLAAILNPFWSWLVIADERVINERVKSGSPIITAYADKKPDDEVRGIDLYNLTRIPVVLLETAPMSTGGDYEKVPKLYSEVTEKGLFRAPSKNPDTILLVDLTAIPSRMGKKGQGEVKETVNFAKKFFSEGENWGLYDLPFDPDKIEHIWTYTPDLEPIRLAHERYGAKDTTFKIPEARNPFKNGLHKLTMEEFRELYPGHNPALHHVNMMSYMG